MESFPQLSLPAQVEAVLASLTRPCTKEYILASAGIDINNIDSQALRAVDEVLQRWKVQDQADSPDSLYWVPLEHQQRVIECLGADQKSVHAQIASVFLKSYGRRNRFKS